MIAQTPYARMLGIRTIEDTEGRTVLVMPATPDLEGRPGFLYGGVIASLLELACFEAVAHELGERAGWPKPINVAFDFLRGGAMTDCHAQARLSRVGRRVVNAEAVCWQADREKPIATGRMHLLMDQDG